jgi:hypothetical protein
MPEAMKMDFLNPSPTTGPREKFDRIHLDIVRDIAEYCDEILLTEPGGENRAQGLRQLSLQFEPGQVVDMALRSEQFLPRELQSL